jgi:hypothetical protein
MVTDGGGYTTYSIFGASFPATAAGEFDECTNLGLSLVVPRSHNHAVSLIEKYGATSIVPGIYAADNTDASACSPLSSQNSCTSLLTPVNGRCTDGG